MSKFDFEIHAFDWDIIEFENNLSKNGFNSYDIKEVTDDYIIFESKGKIYKTTADCEITEMN